ncbi:MAG: hypothetical protein CM1200mP5_1900 [Candidatus Pelagibacterales bacterium]|nr:MAG: hypothetical protein CM1200mP5_1900 [Pelagibacterales bacterium]
MIKVIFSAGAAMGMMIFYTNVSVRVAYVLLTKKILVKFLIWRNIGNESIQAKNIVTSFKNFSGKKNINLSGFLKQLLRENQLNIKGS